jgi:hypothetical protein
MVKRRNEVITECPVRRIGTMSSEACVARERCAGWHKPERSEWAKCGVKGCGDQIQVLACLFSVESVRAIRGGKSGGKDNRLCATPTTTLLTPTNNEWSHLDICRADERSNAERSTNLGRTHNKVCRSGRLGVKRVVVGSLYRINHECSAARCAPRGGEGRPRLNRADLA